MVQKKMAKACSKLAAVQPSKNTLKTEKKQATAKHSLQNHDVKSKVADLKAVKMKKSRSIKRCNVNISLQSLQPPLVAPAHTPSPKKALHCKSPCNTSPNYMKSTTSSEARKENTAGNLSRNSGTSKFQKVAKTLNKACSSMKKMRSLTKVPSFKHTRSGSCKKMVICQSDLDVQKATCSSTLKHSKFPSYLELEAGATEAEGNSVFKVCPYTYCSLNGHHHVRAPPLKRFLPSRWRLLKTMKFRPEVRKVKPAECSTASGGGGDGQVEDFFVEVYAPGGEAGTQVSESVSDGPCSEADFEDNVDQIQVTSLSGRIPPSLIQKQTSFESITDSLDDYFGENSELEWEEGQSPATHDSCEIYEQTVDCKDQDKAGFELFNNDSRCLDFSAVDQDDEAGLKLNYGYVEFQTEGYTAYCHDEIVESLHFSDTDSVSDGESTQTGYKHIEELMVKDDMSSEPNDAIMEDSNLVDEEMVQPTADFAAKEREPSEEMIQHIPQITNSFDTKSTNCDKICSANNGDQAGIDQSGSANAADYCLSRRTETSEEKPHKVQLVISDENDEVEVETSGRKDNKRTGLNSNSRESSSDLILVDSSSKLKRVSRCRKAEEDFVEGREFNPRGPNFLAVEPDPDAEKVDLRHQEMDDRRNAEEWMLDYALQKTVNQLAPARKRKVALLVEAFESVLPIPKFESHRSRSSPGFTQARTIQACS